ncbi:MAG: hypothetical protein WD467_04055 [Candidatus Saccharimonadales bacterium]
MQLLLHPKTVKELALLDTTGAFVVHGPAGVGKTTAVLERLVPHRPQVIVPEPTAIKLAAVRELSSHFHLKGRVSERRIIVIDRADTMTVAAQNALLKTLEEVPAQAQIVLIADELGRLLPTIRSRCHQIYFQAPTSDQVAAWLAEQEHGLNSEEIALFARNLPARVTNLLADPEVLAATKRRYELIEKLFSTNHYEALRSARILQPETIEVLEDCIAYARQQLRLQSGRYWEDAIQSCRYAQDLLSVNANKRYILDAIALSLRPAW